MTKLPKSGMVDNMAKQKLKGTNDIDIKGLDDLKPGMGIDVGDNTKYEYASELSTDGMPLIDPGGGPVAVIRVFSFKMNPERKHFPGKQALFNSHAKQIGTILWGDGLRPLESHSPRVIINNKKGFYQIFVPCGAAKGVIFSERDRNPELLHNQLNGKLDPKRM